MSSDTQRVSLLECPLDVVDFEEAASWCLSASMSKENPSQLVTVNAQSLLMMHDDPAMGGAIREAAMVVADGASMALAARILRLPWKGRVTGVDLMARLMREGASRGLKVYFLGATDQVLERLLAVTRERYPGLIVAGYQNGYFDRENDAEVIDRIRASGADILFVGMPTPFKEVWLHRNLSRFGAGLAIGVGGTFDVLAGLVPRAPLWMQRAGLEWSWRLMMEPRKLWKRNLVYNSRFVGMLLREKVRRGRAQVETNRRESEKSSYHR
jgi:N-acetylglucosaminyldiphosphoundecaprenol N-acetyl-beta-D-mannosaminyltransferase